MLLTTIIATPKVRIYRILGHYLSEGKGMVGEEAWQIIITVIIMMMMVKMMMTTMMGETNEGDSQTP